MKIITWFLLACKRQLKHPFFVVMLVLMPAVLFGFAQVEEQDSGKIRIALYSKEQEMVSEILTQLTEQDGMFQFYICDSGQALKDDVASRRAECGYLFTEDFKEKLDNRKFKRSIEVYSAPSTIMQELAKEVVFASIIEVYGEEILTQFMDANDIFPVSDKGKLLDELLESYELQRSDGRTFSFRYETLSTQPIEESVARIEFPVKGMLAVYLMVVGMFSAVTLIKDERSGLFVSLPFGYGLPCKLAVLAAPVALAGVSAGLTLMITGNAGLMWKETAALVVYLLLVTVVSYLWKCIVRDPLMLCGLIPIFILASLVLCPIFIDISQWLPGVEPVRYLLLPYYYIRVLR